MSDRSQRSWLLVPASNARQVSDAARSGADAVVLDLVELVSDADRPAARDGIRAATAAAGAGGAAVYVQTAPESLEADLRACAGPGLAGIVISRVETAEMIENASAWMDRQESAQGIAPGTLKIVAAVETAPGNHAAHDIARASPRVIALTLGRADLVMDLRPEPSGELHLMPYLMQRLVIIAAAAGVTPLGAWWRAPDRGLLATPDNTLRAGERGRAIGFKGSFCLRTGQVEPLNRVYGSAAGGGT